jgi:hypothetical protein
VPGTKIRKILIDNQIPVNREFPEDKAAKRHLHHGTSGLNDRFPYTIVEEPGSLQQIRKREKLYGTEGGTFKGGNGYEDPDRG